MTQLVRFTEYGKPDELIVNLIDPDRDAKAHLRCLVEFFTFGLGSGTASREICPLHNLSPTLPNHPRSPHGCDHRTHRSGKRRRL